jgi:short-subunit dehydrogenase
MTQIYEHYHFASKKKGHIVGVSSIAAIRGGSFAAYHASKAYISTYLEGLACKSYSQKNNIVVTDIRPGFVNTAMAKGDGIFWKSPVEKAVKQIFNAIKKKRRIAYITKRWWLIGLLMYCLPFTLYRKAMN